MDLSLFKHRETIQDGKGVQNLIDDILKANNVSIKIVGIGELVDTLIEDASEGRLPINNKNRWRLLSEETPPVFSENYLVLKDGQIKISLFRGDWNMFHCDIYREVGEPYVTHWMYLPNSPIKNK